MSIQTLEKRFLHRDGTLFHTRLDIPEHPRAIIVLAHGLGEHIGRYTHVAEFFAGNGFATYFYDQRGHGKSGGTRGDVSDFTQWIDDLRMFIWEAKRSVDVRVPAYVLGHSLGGLIAIHLAAYYDDADGFIISAPSIAPTVNVPAWKMWIGRRMMKALPKAPIGAHIDPRHLSRDPMVVEAYRTDPLVMRRVTLRAGSEILKATMDTMPLAYRIQRPMLMVQARGDKVCSPEATRIFFENIIYPVKRLRLYDGSFHEPHNDVIRETVFNDMRSWLEGLMRHDGQGGISLSPYQSLVGARSEATS